MNDKNNNEGKNKEGKCENGEKKDNRAKEDNMTFEQATNSIKNRFEEKISRPTMEETHIRRSFLINRELDKQINELAKDQGRGWKTHFINHGLEMLVKSYGNQIKDGNACDL